MLRRLWDLIVCIFNSIFMVGVMKCIRCGFLVDIDGTQECLQCGHKNNFGLETKANGLRFGGTYWHYKGGYYQLKFRVMRESDGKSLLVYKDILSGKLWCRPENEFLEEVEVCEQKLPRFKLIGKGDWK